MMYEVLTEDLLFCFAITDREMRTLDPFDTIFEQLLNRVTCRFDEAGCTGGIRYEQQRTVRTISTEIAWISSRYITDGPRIQ